MCVSPPGFLGQSGSRAASQTNVYLESFGFRDNQAFDTMSVDSTDSIETSISACSPDNVSRCERLLASAVYAAYVFIVAYVASSYCFFSTFFVRLQLVV